MKDKETRFKLSNNFFASRAILAFLAETKIEIKSDWKERERDNLEEIDSWDLESISGFSRLPNELN